MKNTTIVLLMLLSTIGIKAQDNANRFRIGFAAAIENNLSSQTMQITEYTGYTAEYKNSNYRLGVNVEYGLSNRFSLISAVNYSNKDFLGTYYCMVCDYMVLPGPEEIEFRFLEVPLAVRYYFLPGKIRGFGELGLNNQFALNNKITDNSYGLGIKFGVGMEYEIPHNIALQILIDYNKGITDLYSDSNFKVAYLAFGIGVMKRL